jgi:hypothetical protein
MMYNSRNGFVLKQILYGMRVTKGDFCRDGYIDLLEMLTSGPLLSCASHSIKVRNNHPSILSELGKPFFIVWMDISEKD